MKKYPNTKDSGLDWIGEIPKHWDVKRLKFTTKFDLSTVDRHEFDDEIPVSICHYPQVYKNETISLKTELPKGTCNEKEFEKFRLKKDDVLITKDSETPNDIGVPVYIQDDFENAVCGYHIAQLETNKKELSGVYLFRYLQSNFANAYFETEANGVTRFGLGKDSISNLKILIPSLMEQKQITKFLDKGITKINSLMYRNKVQHEILSEYRLSLISSAVTGKIDVREAIA